MANLRNLDISETNLMELPAHSLAELENLETVILPNTLTSIGKRVFYRSGLQSVEIPVSVKIIERGAFAYCTDLTSVTFEKNSRLKTIEGSSGDSHIYDYGAFSSCTSLTSIEIPASVETIEPAAFEGCKALTTVTFEKGSQLKTIQSTYQVIDHGAFCYLTNLKTVDMSTCTQVERIDFHAFEGCYDIQLVKIGTATPPDAFGAFEIYRFSILKVPSESVEAYKNADVWKEFPSISALY